MTAPTFCPRCTRHYYGTDGRCPVCACVLLGSSEKTVADYRYDKYLTKWRITSGEEGRPWVEHGDERDG